MPPASPWSRVCSTATSARCSASVGKATAPVVDAWVAEAGKKDVDGRAALEALRAEVQKVAE